MLERRKMYEDRKAYLRDVAHNVAVCRNKLDSILKAIGWTHSSLQVQALGELGSKIDTSDEDPSGVNDGNISNEEPTPSDEPRKSNHLLSTTLKYPLKLRHTKDGKVMNNVLTDQPSKGRQIVMIGCSMLPQNPGKTYSELVQSLTNLPNVKIEKKKKDTELMVEMLAMERDAKRRRTSYKNKVHTKNKSHLEVLREVVEQQMELLKGLDDKETPAEPDDKQKETREDMLIELKDISGTGNPYLIWQNVEKYLVNTESQVQNIAKSEKGHKDNEKYQYREEKTKHENHRKHKHKSRDRSPSSRHRRKERKERSRSRHKHSPSSKHHKRSPSRYEHSHSHSKKSRHS